MKTAPNKTIIIISLACMLFASCCNKHMVKVGNQEVFECDKLYQEIPFDIKEYKIYEIKDWVFLMQKRNNDLKKVIECQKKYLDVFLNEKN